MLRPGPPCRASARLASTEAGSAFLQPLDLHVEPADPLVELGLERLALIAAPASAIAEERLGAVEELLLPLADLDGVDLIRLGELGDGSGLLGGLQGDLSLEGGRMPFACTGHEAPRDGSEDVDQSNIPSCPGNGIHLIVQDVPLRDRRVAVVLAEAPEGPVGDVLAAV